MIVAENIEGMALSMLVHNHVNGIFQCVAVRAPGFGDRRLHKLEDIAALTGGMVYSRHSGFTLETMTVEHLGRARQVWVTADTTAIIGGGGSSEDVEFRLRAAARRARPRDASASTRTCSPSGSARCRARSPSSGWARRPPPS